MSNFFTKTMPKLLKKNFFYSVKKLKSNKFLFLNFKLKNIFNNLFYIKDKIIANKIS